MHEASLYEKNCFITLTYNNNHLPAHASLEYRDFQLFMKRLRKWYEKTNRNTIKPGLQGRRQLRHLTNELAGQENNDQQSKAQAINNSDSKPRIRFYAGGEYGEKNKRPHFHACLFNIDFDDKKLLSLNHLKQPLYVSQTLDAIWGKGITTVGSLTFQSAAYVARYIMKKMTGKDTDKHYETIDEETGEIIIRKREFNQMSRGKGIGYHWLTKFWTDVYPHGKVVINGHEAAPPRYYDNQFKKQNEKQYKEMKLKRQQEGDKHSTHKTPARLKDHQQVKAAQLKQLKRNKL